MAEIPPNLLPDEASPYWMSKGDNAWQLTAETLVGLQSVPGLVILYGSIVKKKWAVNSAFMALYAFAVVLVCCVGWGYRISFENKMLPFLGRPDISLDQKFLLDKAYCDSGLFPIHVRCDHVLVAGALLGRMNFYAWMLFVPLWLTFSYTHTACSLWCPDGWLAKVGIIDYTGGYDRERFPPNNILLMLAGVGLLWIGWSGLNAGGPFAVNTDASLAILNTHVCTATSLLTWLLLDIIFFGNPSVIGATQGMITGLVCITPVAGVVQGLAAILIRILSGSIPWCSMMVLHKKIWLLKQVDDTMAVFHTRAVAGSLEGILAGFLANPKLNRIFYLHCIGLAYGLQNGRFTAGFKQMVVQFLGIVFVVVLNVSITSAICLLIQLVVPLRLTDEKLQTGDYAIHGEEAYTFWGDGEK
ncbi:hypothetical protein SADUNF_Sadunf05G0160400 [Salix dunnii]|uniref:Ammonium transporter AmtB-like domain-containing protein n=1 Tax=Salix dunnii TaxID=1413687 RepID=A0A835MZN3_9ROSI|nr:hypothetical protein SADUNF_Sadunf05G0160400 [Salix dunnii]